MNRSMLLGSSKSKKQLEKKQKGEDDQVLRRLSQSYRWMRLNHTPSLDGWVHLRR